MNRFLPSTGRTLAGGAMVALTLSGCPAANRIVSQLPPVVKDLLASVTAAAGEVVVTGQIDPEILKQLGGGQIDAAIQLIGPGGGAVARPNARGEFIVRLKDVVGRQPQGVTIGGRFRVNLIRMVGAARSGWRVQGQSPVPDLYGRLVFPTGTFAGALSFSNVFPSAAGKVIALGRLQTLGRANGRSKWTTQHADDVPEWTSANNPLTLVDTDGDGTKDDQDLDDDNDRAPDDRDEGPFAYDPTEHHDLDGDGLGDNADTDDDNDGQNDALDADDDNDGTPDASDTDDNGDGFDDRGTDVPAFVTRHDLDHDGLADEIDPDDDNDGTRDGGDLDDDNDGIPDTQDLDDDNDGIADARDASDADDDGIADAFDSDASDGSEDGVTANVDALLKDDADLDGFTDAQDPDDDNDGSTDLEDPDARNDGIPDAGAKDEPDAYDPDADVSQTPEE